MHRARPGQAQGRQGWARAGRSSVQIQPVRRKHQQQQQDVLASCSGRSLPCTVRSVSLPASDTTGCYQYRHQAVGAVRLGLVTRIPGYNLVHAALRCTALHCVVLCEVSLYLSIFTLGKIECCPSGMCNFKLAQRRHEKGTAFASDFPRYLTDLILSVVLSPCCCCCCAAAVPGEKCAGVGVGGSCKDWL